MSGLGWEHEIALWTLVSRNLPGKLRFLAEHLPLLKLTTNFSNHPLWYSFLPLLLHGQLFYYCTWFVDNNVVNIIASKNLTVTAQ